MSIEDYYKIEKPTRRRKELYRHSGQVAPDLHVRNEDGYRLVVSKDRNRWEGSIFDQKGIEREGRVPKDFRGIGVYLTHAGSKSGAIEKIEKELRENSYYHVCGEGKEYVPAHVKDDGTYVRGFCRKKHDLETRHDIAVDRKNIRKAQEERRRK